MKYINFPIAILILSICAILQNVYAQDDPILLNQKFTIEVGDTIINGFTKQLEEIRDSLQQQKDFIKIKGIMEDNKIPVSNKQILIVKVTDKDVVEVLFENGEEKIPGLISVGNTDSKGNFSIGVARKNVMGIKIRCTILVDVGGFPITYSKMLPVFFEVDELKKEIDLGKIIIP